MHSISYYSKDEINSRCNCAHEVDKYERRTEYGVTRIFFHVDVNTGWAIAAGLTLIPGLFYLGDQAFNDGGLCTGEGTHYFDAHSGEQISYSTAQENKNKNRQADQLNNEGNELNRQGRYREAYEKFQEAYIKCTSGYSEEERFKNNRDIAKNNLADQLNNEGGALSGQGNHEGAYEKYNEAYKLCTQGYKNQSLFKDNRDSAKEKMDRNEEANRLNNEGNELHRQGRYREAYEKFKKAYDSCTEDYSEISRIKQSRDIARNMFADQLNQRGDELYRCGKYKKAEAKYQEACEVCTSDYGNKSIFLRNKTKAEENKNKNIRAERLERQGNDLFNEGKYKEAYELFYEASLTCTRDYKHKQAIERKADKAQINENKNREANSLDREGNDLFNEGKYAEASEKFLQAAQTCTCDYRHKQSIERKANKANENKNKNINAANLAEKGAKLLREGKYREAYQKYSEACQTCTNDYMERENFISNRDIAQTKENTNKQAETLHQEGLQLYAGQLYEEALEKFEQSFSMCLTGLSEESALIKIQYRANVEGTKVELEAIRMNHEGERLSNEGKFHEAAKKYKSAYHTSKVPGRRRIYAENMEVVENHLVTIIQTMWTAAWIAEDDEENDRSAEAKETFQKVLNEAKNASVVFPYRQDFKQFVDLSSLKLDGNELVNQGLELQDDGVSLLEQAKQLIQIQNYQLADGRFREAQNKFTAAKNKFEIGHKSDDRFESCIQFVQERIVEVAEGLQGIEQQNLRDNLNSLKLERTEPDGSDKTCFTLNNNYQQVI